jgi:alkyl hydroperoxide reductase subunit AhpC
MLRSLLTVLLIGFAPAAFALPEIGKPAPDFKATDVITGKPVQLSALKGRTVVLEWNNPQCPFVKKYYSVGAMQQLQARAAKQGVHWVSINSSAEGKEGYFATNDVARDALAERNAQPEFYVRDPKGEIGKLYDAKTTPHMFVIDKTGVLVYMGAIDSKPTADSADIATATNYVTEALHALKSGKPVKTSSTKPYGCFVKY